MSNSLVGLLAQMEAVGLLVQVEAASGDDQWGLIREVARKLLVGDSPGRLQINQLTDAGGHETATLRLVENLLPGHVAGFEPMRLWTVKAERWFDGRWGAGLYRVTDGTRFTADAETFALALLAALLKALIAKDAK